jgi:hypothetical protein
MVSLRTKRVCVNISFLAVILSLLMGGSEFTVRWVFRDVTTTTDNWSYFARHWHRTVRTNSYGFRERDFSLTKPRGIYRIAVIGDSIAYGQGIDEQDRFSNLIEKQLARQKGPRQYEVLNFGQPGAETIDHLKILAYPVLEAEPDFVVLEWFTNDVEGHDKSKRPRPLRLAPGPLAGLMQRYSAIFYLLNQHWVTMQQKIGWLSSGTYEDYMLQRFSDPNSPSSVAAQDTLRGFIDICKQRRIPVGIVLFTSPYWGGFALDFLTERALQVCREETIRCLDLRSTFFHTAAVSNFV